MMYQGGPCHQYSLPFSIYSRSDPLWQEVAKRYQEIIEKEYKLLGQYYDGQTASQTTTVTPTLYAPLILKGRNGHHSRGQTKGASCKPTEKDTETGNVAIEECNYTSRMAEKTMDNDNLPKIVEVYSLNPVKSQDEVYFNKKTNGVIMISEECGLNKNDPDGFPCKDEENSKMNNHLFTKQASESLIQDPNPCAPSSGKKSPLLSDNFIDLTVDEEEETSVYEKAVNIYENGSVENTTAINHQPKEETADNEGQLETKPERRKNKRKGGFGYNRRRKRRRPAKYQERKTSNSPSSGLDVGVLNSNSVEGCDGRSNLCNSVNDNEEDYRNDGCKQNVWDQNNNNTWSKKETNKIAEEMNQTFSGSGGNSEVNGLLDMYRENKITTLKARLAKQEEELAKLRIQKESIHVQANYKNLEAPCTYSSAANSDTKADRKQTEYKDNFNIQSLSNREEEDVNIQSLSNRENVNIQSLSNREDVNIQSLSNREEDVNIQSLSNREEEDEIVTLDEICQHVIKSFDIFNARQCRNTTKENTDLHSSKVPKKNNCVLKQDGNDNCLKREQDKFLLQIGLKRRPFSSN